MMWGTHRAWMSQVVEALSGSPLDLRGWFPSVQQVGSCHALDEAHLLLKEFGRGFGIAALSVSLSDPKGSLPSLQEADRCSIF